MTDATFDLAEAFRAPKVICTCDLFGQGQIIITFTDVGYGVRPVPNRWIRFWTQVFFNTKWNFNND
jgi:hypothetical protein